MIKKLRLKFVLVFLVLVVSVFITSSCYASPSSAVTYESSFTLDDVRNSSAFKTYTTSYESLSNYRNAVWKFIVYKTDDSTQEKIYCFVASNDLKVTIPDTAVFKLKSGTSDYLFLHNESGSVITGINYFIITYDNTTGAFSTTQSNGSISTFNGSSNLANCTTFKYSTLSEFKLSAYGLNFEPITVPDTSFEYSFNGIKRGQVELKIDGLDSSLNMYGYVGVENTYEIGDTFVSSKLSEYLRLIGMHSDNSDLSCSLYEGEKLLYYIVDEDNVILDIGYISELAEGYFLYGFPVSDGVDFVFLNNGQVYWNNDLTFKYQVNNANLLTKNEIVSAGNYSYIESDKTTAKIIYNGFVYDSNGEVLLSATTSTTNDLSSFCVKEVNTNYYENNVGYNKSCYWLYSITLAGTDYSGNEINFSDYSIRWSIPTWLTIDSLEVKSVEYDKYNGTVTGFSSSGYLQLDLKIYELLKNHTSDFDITLEIYDNKGDLVLTYLVNSDDIVKNQILDNENNIDKPDYDITDDPSYTGGSGNKDFSDIQNWTEDDYKNLMSTDNFIWSFFKAILGNLPWWITVPITILIFGVVIITLIRFARGA